MENCLAMVIMMVTTSMNDGSSQELTILLGGEMIIKPMGRSSKVIEIEYEINKK